MHTIVAAYSAVLAMITVFLYYSGSLILAHRKSDYNSVQDMTVLTFMAAIAYSIC